MLQVIDLFFPPLFFFSVVFFPKKVLDQNLVWFLSVWAAKLREFVPPARGGICGPRLRRKAAWRREAPDLRHRQCHGECGGNVLFSIKLESVSLSSRFVLGETSSFGAWIGRCEEGEE